MGLFAKLKPTRAELDASPPLHTSSDLELQAATVKHPEDLKECSLVLDDFDPSAHHPHGIKLVLILLSLILVMFLVALDQTIVSTAIPQIADDFSALSDVGWYGSAYLLAGTAFQPLYGKAYTLFAPKWVFITCTMFFQVGSVVCGAAKSSTAFIVGRAIAGVGYAGLLIGCLAIAAAIVPVEKQAKTISCITAFQGIAIAVGPLLGGAFTSSSATWRWAFYINLPIGGVALVIAILFLNIPARRQELSILARLGSLDWAGSSLLIGSIVCLLIVLQEGGVLTPWRSSKMIGLLVGFVVLFVAFSLVQVYSKSTASIDVRVLRKRSIACLALANAAIGTGYFVSLYFVPIYFQAVEGSSAIRSSVETLPFVLPLIMAIVLSGMFVEKYGFNFQLLSGSSLLAIGAGLLSTLTTSTSTGKWVGYQMLAGTGAGASAMMPYIASQLLLEPNDRPAGGTIAIFAQTLGATIWVSVAQSIYQNKLLAGITQIDGIDVAAVIDSGVTAFREFVAPDLLPEVLDVAVEALSKVFLAAGVLAAFGCVMAAGVEWKRPEKGEKIAAGGA